MSNADAIRSMTDDQLFDFIQRIELQDIDYGQTFCNEDFCDMKSENCDKCLKWWLSDIDAENHPQGVKYYDKS